MIIAGDLEMGGIAGAFNGTAFCTQMGVAATDNPEYAYKLGLVIGREGTAMGYNTVYAPLVDINKNFHNPLVNLRAYSDDHNLVLKMALEQIRGIQESGMAATAKHWPGDGIDDRNQHFVSSCNSLKFEEWNETFGKVYRGVIDAGVLSIMSAHIYLPSYYYQKTPNIDPRNILPGSISYELNTELLRNTLGFNGAIVSDATGMVGMVSHGKREKLVPKVIASGVDQFLFSHPLLKDFEYMKIGFETGIITKERLNDAVKRILAMKAALKLPEKQKSGNLIYPKSQLKVVGCKEHKTWARECNKAGITLVKDTQNLIPINPNNGNRILLIRGGDMKIFSSRFKSYLKQKGFSVKKYKKGMSVSKENFDIIIYLYTRVGVFSQNTLNLDYEKLGGMHWFAEEIPTMFISLGSPYFLYYIPRIKTYINTYTFLPYSQKILVDLLVGEDKFKGKSPVDAYCGIFGAKL
ncbi:MAG: glycoside hydrolase family 3 protein, partial [archaeon]|nr:glycoside hydrolase family 3 protein [archaeon]